MSATFSNSTEYDQWASAWCATCVHDQDENNLCPLPLQAMLDEDVPEWGKGPMWSPQTVVFCMKYEASLRTRTSNPAVNLPLPVIESRNVYPVKEKSLTVEEVLEVWNHVEGCDCHRGCDAKCSEQYGCACRCVEILKSGGQVSELYEDGYRSDWN